MNDASAVQVVKALIAMHTANPKDYYGDDDIRMAVLTPTHLMVTNTMWTRFRFLHFYIVYDCGWERECFRYYSDDRTMENDTAMMFLMQIHKMCIQ